MDSFTALSHMRHGGLGVATASCEFYPVMGEEKIEAFVLSTETTVSMTYDEFVKDYANHDFRKIRPEEL